MYFKSIRVRNAQPQEAYPSWDEEDIGNFTNSWIFNLSYIWRHTVQSRHPELHSILRRNIEYKIEEPLVKGDIRKIHIMCTLLFGFENKNQYKLFKLKNPEYFASVLTRFELQEVKENESCS